MSSLFDTESKAQSKEPLAERMRPKTLPEVVGQSHILGEGKILSEMLKQHQFPSIIFWGPPGTGKTTLANLIANIQPFHLSDLVRLLLESPKSRPPQGSKCKRNTNYSFCRRNPSFQQASTGCFFTLHRKR